jgi:hypothetical protein
MAVSVDVSQNKTFKFDLAQLPATLTKTGDRRLGMIFTLAGVLFCGVVFVILVATLLRLLQGAFKFEGNILGMLLITSLFGYVMLMGGLHHLLIVTTTVDKVRIYSSSRSLFGSKQWAEDLEAYEGILYRDEYHYQGKGSSYPLYIIELYHTNKDKVVILYQSTSPEGVRAIWEDSCRKLNMQAVEKDGSSLIKRDVEDLDKSVRELVNEGKLNFDCDISQSPPKGLQATSVGDMFQVIVKLNYFSLIVRSVFVLAFWVLFVLHFIFISKNWIVFASSSLFYWVAVVEFIFPAAFTRACIKIGEDSLFLNRITPWGETAGTTILTSEIESVVVSDSRGRNEVLIKTDQQEVAIGRGLSAESLQWLKNCILTIIST